MNKKKFIFLAIITILVLGWFSNLGCSQDKGKGGSPLWLELLINGVALFAGIMALIFFLSWHSKYGGKIGRALTILAVSMVIWMISFTLCLAKSLGVINIMQIQLKSIGGTAFVLFAIAFYLLGKTLKTLR